MLTQALLEERTVKRAMRAISAALYECGSLDGAEVHRIYAEATAPPRSESNE
jgi:hypothetical protein